MSYLIRRVLAKPRLILDEMCRLYGKSASYLRRVLCKTRVIFARINGPNNFIQSLRKKQQKTTTILHKCLLLPGETAKVNPTHKSC